MWDYCRYYQRQLLSTLVSLVREQIDDGILISGGIEGDRRYYR